MTNLASRPAWAALAAVGGLLLASCSSPGASPSGSATPAGPPVSIQLAVEASGDTPTAYKEWVERFNGSHPNISVELRTYTGGDAYNQAILGQVAGGVAPDVFLLDGGVRTQTFADSSSILPLDDLASGAGLDLRAFKPSLIDAMKVDGKLYGIPKDYNTTALFYNKDMLQTAGVEPPTTWDELRAAAKTLTTADRYGFGIYPQINYFLAFVVSSGGNFVTPSGLTAVDNPGALAAVSYLRDLFVTDKSAATPQMVGASWDGEMFATGKVAMVYGGSWIPGSISGINVGTVPLPVDQQPGSVIYTAGWVISSKSEHAAQAMELIKFLTSTDELLAGHKAGIVGLPPTTEALQQLKAQDTGDQTLAVAEQVVDNGVSFGWLQPEFVDQYNKMLEGVVTGKTSPEDGLANLAKQAGQ